MDKGEGEMSEEFYSSYATAPIFMAVITNDDNELKEYIKTWNDNAEIVACEDNAEAISASVVSLFTSG